MLCGWLIWRSAENELRSEDIQKPVQWNNSEHCQELYVMSSASIPVPFSLRSEGDEPAAAALQGLNTALAACSSGNWAHSQDSSECSRRIHKDLTACSHFSV